MAELSKEKLELERRLAMAGDRGGMIGEHASRITDLELALKQKASRITDLELASKRSSQAMRDAELREAELSRENLELERRLAQMERDRQSKPEQTYVEASQLKVPTDTFETHGLRIDRFQDLTALRVRLMEHTDDESSQVKRFVTFKAAEALYGRDPTQFPYDPLLPPLIGLGLFEGAQLIGFCSFEAVPFIDGKSVCAYVDLLAVHADHEDKEIGERPGSTPCPAAQPPTACSAQCPLTCRCTVCMPTDLPMHGVHAH